MDNSLSQIELGDLLPGDIGCFNIRNHSRKFLFLFQTIETITFRYKISIRKMISESECILINRMNTFGCCTCKGGRFS